MWSQRNQILNVVKKKLRLCPMRILMKESIYAVRQRIVSKVSPYSLIEITVLGEKLLRG